MPLVHAVIAILAVLLIPSAAYAWGPGMHVEVAMNALAEAAIVAPAIAALMRRFPEAFIYGAASPDIIIGKKYAGYLHHCHNWKMGRMILAEARSDSQRAAAYGYLMHLAADIVAHNYYIPFKMIRGWRARLLSHTYWEMRFDLGVGEEAWEFFDDVDEEDVAEFDMLLERVLRKAIFSFSTNKRIFNTILRLQKMRRLRQSLGIYARVSRFDIEEENRRHYLDLTMEAAMGFLRDPDGAPCLEIDPVGLARLDYAKAVRRSMRSLSRRGMIGRRQADRIVELAKERLALGLYRPEMALPSPEDVI
jgi:hypothetical protein